MHISWHGQYTIKIVSNDTTLVIDPYSPDLGLAPFRAKADIVALTNPSDKNMSHISSIQGEPYIISTPGEYSVREFTLHALSWHNQDSQECSIHLWNIEKLSLLHVGALNRDLTDHELQELEKRDIDILLLPVGGNGLELKQAMHLLTTVEPRVVIPIHYALPGLSEKLAGVESFTREMGVASAERLPKLVIKASKLPQEELTTVILAP